MENFLNEITFWHWWIAGIVLVILEIFAPGFVFVWLGVAAGVIGGVIYFVPTLAWEYQILMFAGLSVASVFAGRMWLRRHPTDSENPMLNQRGRQYVGRHFRLVAAIVDGTGKIRVDDSIWRVSGEDMDEGTSVVVTGVDGATLMVEKSSTEKA